MHHTDLRPSEAGLNYGIKRVAAYVGKAMGCCKGCLGHINLLRARRMHPASPPDKRLDMQTRNQRTTISAHAVSKFFAVHSEDGKKRITILHLLIPCRRVSLLVFLPWKRSRFPRPRTRKNNPIDLPFSVGFDIFDVMSSVRPFQRVSGIRVGDHNVH